VEAWLFLATSPGQGERKQGMQYNTGWRAASGKKLKMRVRFEK
jgi:hypothetical protein